MKKLTRRLVQQLFGAIAFYTTFPIPTRWTLDFTRIARFSPLVGLLLGSTLFLCAQLFSPWLPPLVSSVAVVAVWLKLTGALHLDGAMDAADGLGVFDPAKRLQVMADSRSGAFGVITGVMIVFLKVAAIQALLPSLSLFLLLVPIWGRLAHVIAVGQYPYLKKEGKGALHQKYFVHFWDYIPGILVVLGISTVFVMNNVDYQLLLVLNILVLPLTSWAIGYWFYLKFRGMTGDLYGAIVEWTETLGLIEILWLSKILQSF